MNDNSPAGMDGSANNSSGTSGTTGSTALAATVAEAKRLRLTVLVPIIGSALAPYFNDGDILRVDTTANPEPIDAVIVRLSSDGRQCTMLLRPDGGLWDARGGRVEYGEYELLGVVVDV